MIDSKKTKRQLIEELEELRQKVIELRKESGGKSNSDITKYKRAEEALKESEIKFRSITENAVDFIFIKDMARRYTFVNHAMQELLGLPEEEILGKKPEEIFGPEQGDTIKEIDDRTFSGETVNETRSLVIGDKELFFNTLQTPLAKENGEITSIMGIVRDITDRKNAEEELRKSEEKYKLLTEKSINGIFVIQDSKMAYVNPSFAKLFGYSPEEIIERMSPQDLVHPDDLQFLLNNMSARYSGESQEEMHAYRGLRKDGAVLFIEVLGSLTEYLGKPAILGTITDVTERTRTEEKLHESEENYRSLIENIPDVVWTTDESGHTTFISDNVAKIYGYTPEEICREGKRLWLARIHPDDIDRVREAFEAIVNEGSSFDIEYQIQRKDGRWIWLHDRALKSYNDQGKVRVDGVFSDITKRRRAEEALRESEVRFRTIYENAPVLINAFDENGGCVLWNKHCCEVFGWTIDEINVHDDALALFYPDPAVRDEVMTTVTVKPDGRFREWHPITKDGKTLTTMWANFRLPDGMAFNLGYDITETKRLQELESRAGRLEMAGTIAGQVAHDFNNLLGPLMAYPEFIREELPRNHPTLTYLNQIEKASKKIADINQDLLAMGRRGHYNQEVLNLNTIIQQAVSELEPHPETLACEINLSDDLMDILAGSAQLHRMVSNLLHNAKEAMQNIGQLTVKTENYYVDDVSIVYGHVPKGEYVKLTISDTGCGIPDDIVQKIFDPFFTSKTTDKKRGSGLGMSVVDAVIRDHNGYIDLSTKVGAGTSFYIYFPITRESMDSQDLDKTSGGNETILVVDDDEIQREVSTQLLNNLGYIVSSVESGEKAVKFLSENPHDLVILDMVMPGGIDGAETYRQILEINPYQKAIILSGFSETERVLEAQKLGAGAFVMKPITTKLIASAVRTELERPVSVSSS